MDKQISNKQYIGDIALNREPDLIFEVEGDKEFPIWYNNDEINRRLGKRLGLKPNKDGICEVYFPEKVTSLANMFNPGAYGAYSFANRYPEDAKEMFPGYVNGDLTMNGPYYSRLKRIIGLNKFLKNNSLFSIYSIIYNHQCEYVGDIEHFYVSNLKTIDLDIIYKFNNYNPNAIKCKKIDLRAWKPYAAYDISLGHTTCSILDISTWDFNKINCNVSFQYSPNLKKILISENFTTSKFTSVRWLLSNCNNIEELPFDVDCRGIIYDGNKNNSSTTMGHMFDNCKSLKSITFRNTDNKNCVNWWGTFNNCNNIETINNIDLKSAFCVHPFYTNCPKVKNLVIKNIGYTDWKYINDLFLPGCPENTINLTGVSNWGADNEANRKTLVDSLLTYSFDRRSANRVTHNIWLNSTTLARLTDSEKAAIVAKGYNLISK